jgi:hypothetical protein
MAMAFACQSLIAGRQKENLSVSICVICGQPSAFFHFQSIDGRLSDIRFSSFSYSFNAAKLGRRT